MISRRANDGVVIPPRRVRNLAERDQEYALQLHHQKLRSIRPTISSWNDDHVEITKRQRNNRRTNRVKAARAAEIKRENEILVDRITDQATRNSVQHPGAARTGTKKDRGQEFHTHRSLNYHTRMKERSRIAQENLALAKRIITRKAVLDHTEWDRHAKDHDRMIESMSKYVDPNPKYLDDYQQSRPTLPLYDEDGRRLVHGLRTGMLPPMENEQKERMIERLSPASEARERRRGGQVDPLRQRRGDEYQLELFDLSRLEVPGELKTQTNETLQLRDGGVVLQADGDNNTQWTLKVYEENQIQIVSAPEQRDHDKLHLSLSAVDLPALDWLSKSHPICVMEYADGPGSWMEIGRTELVKSDENNPRWENKITILESGDASSDDTFRFRLFEADDDSTPIAVCSVSKRDLKHSADQVEEVSFDLMKSNGQALKGRLDIKVEREEAPQNEATPEPQQYLCWNEGGGVYTTEDGGQENTLWRFVTRDNNMEGMYVQSGEGTFLAAEGSRIGTVPSPSSSAAVWKWE